MLAAGLDLSDPRAVNAFLRGGAGAGPDSAFPLEPLETRGIAAGLWPRIEEIAAYCDRVCAQALDDSYVTLARRLTAKLGRERPLAPGSRRHADLGGRHPARPGSGELPLRPRLPSRTCRPPSWPRC